MSDDDYKRGYRDGFKDAMDSFYKFPTIPIPDPNKAVVIPTVFPEWPKKSPTETDLPQATICSVCGMSWVGVMSYSCGNMKCPIQPRITS